MVVTLETGQALFVWPCLEIERYNEYQAKKVPLHNARVSNCKIISQNKVSLET